MHEVCTARESPDQARPRASHCRKCARPSRPRTCSLLLPLMLMLPERATVTLNWFCPGSSGSTHAR